MAPLSLDTVYRKPLLVQSTITSLEEFHSAMTGKMLNCVDDAVRPVPPGNVTAALHVVPLSVLRLYQSS